MSYILINEALLIVIINRRCNILLLNMINEAVNIEIMSFRYLVKHEES
jgi:hypothetical protein